MRLLKRLSDGNPSLTSFDDDDTPRYAILSHTWSDGQEVTYQDLSNGTGKHKTGWDKIQFCIDQAATDGIEYTWVDTCCIDKYTSDEVSTSINSMFRWYQRAAKCYVYLPDVEVPAEVVDPQAFQITWINVFRRSRWFTRGWTLQELLAPAIVEFFSKERKRLGSKISLEQDIHEVTKIPLEALRKPRLSEFSFDERIGWAAKRKTTKKEDRAYCLLGIFAVYMPLIYGEGEENAMRRLRDEVTRSQYGQGHSNIQGMTGPQIGLTASLPHPVSQERQSSAAPAEADLYDTSERAGLKRKRKRTLDSSTEMSRAPKRDGIRTAIGKLEKLSNYIQTHLQDEPAQKIVRHLATILDGTRQSSDFGCLLHKRQDHRWSELKNSLLFSRRVSVNSRPPKNSPAQDSRITRKSDCYTFEDWRISLNTTHIHSHDEHGREVLQSLSVMSLQPCCSNTGSPVAIFFGERVDFHQRSIIHPVILAYRVIAHDSEVFRLVEVDDVDGVKKLVWEQEVTTRDCDEYGISLLTTFTKDALKYLFESLDYADNLNVNRLEQDPLVMDDEKVMPLLANKYSDQEASEIFLARSLQCRRYLLEADADPMIGNNYTATPIKVALGDTDFHGGTTAFLDLLLRHGRAFIDLELPMGNHSLWLHTCRVTWSLITPIVFRKLLDAGCNANETDVRGWNCLFHCVLCARCPESSKEFEALQYLLRLPIDRHATDETGRTVFDHVNDQNDPRCGSYQQDLWLCALGRAGFDISDHPRNAKYTRHYTPMHYYALRYLSRWAVQNDDIPEQLQRLDGQFQMTAEEILEMSRITEVTSDESSTDNDSLYSSDNGMEDRLSGDIDDEDDEEDEEEEDHDDGEVYDGNEAFFAPRSPPNA